MNSEQDIYQTDRLPSITNHRWQRKKAVMNDGKQLLLTSMNPSWPLVVMISAVGIDDVLMEACAKEGCPPFNLLSIGNLRWDEELSPWPSEPVVMKNDHFTGEADSLVSLIGQTILPWAFEQLEAEPETLVMAGYSMGGLFSLYAPYRMDGISKVVCASGSLWYPGWINYALDHSMKQKPEAICFSLGRKEIQTRNPYLQTTGKVMEELVRHYSSEGIDCRFLWNPGDHFVDVPERLARDLKWVLEAGEPDSSRK